MTTRKPKTKTTKAPATVPAFNAFERSHWFVSSALSWCADDVLSVALKKLAARHKSDWKLEKAVPIAIYRVPGACATTMYGIVNYRPAIDGAVIVGHDDLGNMFGE